MSACDALTGEEVARMDIQETSDRELIIKQATVNLKKGDEVAFWTEMDLEYENDLALRYSVEVWKDSQRLKAFDLDALNTNVRMMEVRTSFGNKTSWSYTGRMGKMEIAEDGIYDFKAILRSSGNPTLVLNKANLVLKR